MGLAGEGVFAPFDSEADLGMEEWFRALNPSEGDPPHVLVHFHGGLVPGPAGRERVAAFLDAWGPPGVHAVFVVWRTGAGEIAPQAIADLVERSAVERLAAFVRDWADRPTGRRSLVGTDDPEELLEALLADLEVEPDLLDALEEDDEVRPELKRSAADAPRDPARRLVGTVAAGAIALGAAVVSARAIAGVRKRRGKLGWNGTHDTAVEEVVRALGLRGVAASGWQRIRTNAEQAYGEGRGARKLAEHLVAHREAGGRISIVAHSAGSLHAGALIGAMAALSPRGRLVENLLHVAPACDHREAARILELGDRIGRYRLFALDDETERVEALGGMVGSAYEGSLLTLISGLLEPSWGWPVLGMQRYVERHEAYDAFRELLGCDRCSIWSPSGDDEDGRRTTWAQHGGFDLDRATVASIRHWFELPVDGGTP